MLNYPSLIPVNADAPSAHAVNSENQLRVVSMTPIAATSVIAHDTLMLLFLSGQNATSNHDLFTQQHTTVKMLTNHLLPPRKRWTNCGNMKWSTV